MTGKAEVAEVGDTAVFLVRATGPQLFAFKSGGTFFGAVLAANLISHVIDAKVRPAVAVCLAGVSKAPGAFRTIGVYGNVRGPQIHHLVAGEVPCLLHVHTFGVGKNRSKIVGGIVRIKYPVVVSGGVRVVSILVLRTTCARKNKRHQKSPNNPTTLHSIPRVHRHLEMPGEVYPEASGKYRNWASRALCYGECDQL